jgi:hypothetical protein
VTANNKTRSVGYKRIATEETWAPHELIKEIMRIVDSGELDDPGLNSLWGFYGASQAEWLRTLLHKIQRIDESRIADMDASGIDMAGRFVQENQVLDQRHPVATRPPLLRRGLPLVNLTYVQSPSPPIGSFNARPFQMSLFLLILDPAASPGILAPILDCSDRTLDSYVYRGG